ncbi:hypothetical protein L1987_69473 [Smallanthus sonchifolius]|uniref:Uncharacterized protein n=1 Tax=Smallanthus sonchifolius TaxID=185202 RepID=A0ACB9B650_9ASTR|nr:hypothetical protein L1987_69473 [Smallanthus sonchifolius]
MLLTVMKNLLSVRTKVRFVWEIGYNLAACALCSRVKTTSFYFYIHLIMKISVNFCSMWCFSYPSATEAKMVWRRF